MMGSIEFVVGQQYENRKGVYEVLAVEGDTMHIRWEGGEEIDTTVTMQSHIIRRMRCESERIAQSMPSPIIENEIPKGWKHRITR